VSDELLLSRGYVLDPVTNVWCRTYTNHREPPDYHRNTPHKLRRKLTDDQIEEARRLRAQRGLSMTRLAEQFGVSAATMRTYLGLRKATPLPTEGKRV
jgi:hypothetical protein